MRIKPNVLLIAIIAATGGLLFGFDTGVISGALPFLKDNWALNDERISLLTTGVLFGAVLGALFSGRLADRLGRKKMIIVNAVIFAVGAIGCGFAPSIGTLIAMRVLVGIAIGITSYVVPMYIAEISPVAHRGMLVTLNQLMITIGLLSSYIADYLFSNNADPGSWRGMFLVGTIPALVLPLDRDVLSAGDIAVVDQQAAVCGREKSAGADGRAGIGGGGSLLEEIQEGSGVWRGTGGDVPRGSAADGMEGGGAAVVTSGVDHYGGYLFLSAVLGCQYHYLLFADNF